MIGSWLRGLRGKGQSTSTSARQAKPWLEALEDRTVPTLTISPFSSATNLANAIAGTGVKVSNASYTTSTKAAGTFTGGLNDIGLSSGVYISTGLGSNIVGPFTAATPIGGTNLGQPGNAALSALIGAQTLDAEVLTFNFVAQSTSVTLQAVIATNEITSLGPPPAVTDDDIAGVFVNGNNIAMVNFNQLRDNIPPAAGAAPLDIKFNVETAVQTFTATGLKPGAVNTIQIAIADGPNIATGALNDLIDTVVFIGAASLTGTQVVALNPVRFTYAYNAATKTYNGFITIVNTGSTPLSGLTSLSITNLPKGTTVTNQPLVGGVPTINLTGLPTLAPGASVRIAIDVFDPLREPLPTFFTAQGLLLS